MSEPYLPPPDDGHVARGIMTAGAGAGAARGSDTGGGSSSTAVHIGKLFVAGTAGGLVECVASYPLDTVKTRMQTQTGVAEGPFSCFRSIVGEDGARALYRGMSSRIVASMIASSVLFGVNGTLKELFQADSRKPTSGRFLAAAAGTGVLEAVVYCPFELVKTRMQVLRGSQEGVTAWSTGVNLYRKHGAFKGCYRGFSTLLLKESVGNTVYFSSYEFTKQTLARCGEGESAGVGPIAVAGGLAGMGYALAVQPIDTVKTLVQTDSMRAPQYRGLYDASVQSLAQRGGGLKGFVGLYRGLSPALARSFVSNAVLFLTFEATMDALGR